MQASTALVSSLVRWFHHTQKTLFHPTVFHPLALTVFLLLFWKVGMEWGGIDVPHGVSTKMTITIIQCTNKNKNKNLFSDEL